MGVQDRALKLYSASAGGVPVCMKCALSYYVGFYSRHPELSEKSG